MGAAKDLGCRRRPGRRTRTVRRDGAFAPWRRGRARALASGGVRPDRRRLTIPPGSRGGDRTVGASASRSHESRRDLRRERGTRAVCTAGRDRCQSRRTAWPRPVPLDTDRRGIGSRRSLRSFGRGSAGQNHTGTRGSLGSCARRVQWCAWPDDAGRESRRVGGRLTRRVARVLRALREPRPRSLGRTASTARRSQSRHRTIGRAGHAAGFAARTRTSPPTGDGARRWARTCPCTCSR